MIEVEARWGLKTRSSPLTHALFHWRLDPQVWELNLFEITHSISQMILKRDFLCVLLPNFPAFFIELVFSSSTWSSQMLLKLPFRVYPSLISEPFNVLLCKALFRGDTVYSLCLPVLLSGEDWDWQTFLWLKSWFETLKRRFFRCTLTTFLHSDPP